MEAGPLTGLCALAGCRDGTGTAQPGAGQVTQLSKARLLLSHFHPAGAPRLGSGPLRLPTLLEFCYCFPRASILHALAAPRAVTPSPTLQICLLSSALSTVSPEMMSLASSGAELPLRPCCLLSRTLPRSLEEASLQGTSGLLLSPPAARPLLRRLLASACPLSLPSLSVSLPTLPSIRPFSLSLRPVRCGSSLPGSARLWVAPSKGGSIQPEGFTALHWTHRPEGQPFTWEAAGEGGREGLGIPCVRGMLADG